MRRSPGELVVSAVVSLLVLAASSAAQEGMRYVYHAPESPLDRRYDYVWEILKEALERTRGTYGEYEMVASAPMSEDRQIFELKHATGQLTVMYQTTTPELERALIPVRIPVDKGLVGYRVFMIRKGEQDRFASVRTLDDLRRLTYGQGQGWVDVKILKAGGFHVVTGSDYDGLFRMLTNGRFDAFPRGIIEVIDEYDRRKEELSGLAVEQCLLLYYPLPTYFWFAKTAEGQRLSARVREGMLAMIADGTYDRTFFAFQGDRIKRLGLKDRRVFRVENPLLDPETPVDEKRFWFDPTRDAVPAHGRRVAGAPR